MSGMRRRTDSQRCETRFFGADEKGIAAVEFAFILPLMLLIYLGVFYLSRGMRAAQRVDLVAHVIADLAGQQLSGGVGNGQAALADADFTQIFMAATVLLSPMPTTSLKITISEVNIWQPTPTTYQANVNWTHTYQGGTARNSLGCGPAQNPLLAQNVSPISPTSMPTNYTDPTQTPALGPVIVVDVSYGYPLGIAAIPIPWTSNGVLTLLRTSYAPVRNQYVTPANPTQPTLYPLYNHIQDLTTVATPGTNCLAGWGGTQ